jgi:hypothetical protein
MPDSEAVQALIKAYVACQLALEVLDDLPEHVREAVSEPVQALCRVVGPEVERLNSGSETA